MKNLGIFMSTPIQKMRGNPAFVAFSLMSLAALSARRSHAAAAFAEATSFVSFDGKDAGTYLYNNLSFKLQNEKINNVYKVVSVHKH